MVNKSPGDGVKSWPRRLISVGLLLAALVVLLFTVKIVFWTDPDEDRPVAEAATPLPSPTSRPLGIVSVDYPTPYPTLRPTSTLTTLNWIQATAGPAEIAAALDSPVIGQPALGALARQLDPLTILPSRARGSVLVYAVQRGDTLKSIAEKFGLQESSIIWSNDRFYVNAMRIGLELNIIPVDGAYHHVIEPQTISSIAEEYDVDPYTIIDSEFNVLFGATPQSILPSGYYVVVPGGTGSTEPIYWDPGIVMTTDGSNPVGSGAYAGMGSASFAVGDPGSCGVQSVVGGSPPYTAPIWRNYTITQDFNWVHGGIDLAVPVGTPVYAAGGGTVIFTGLSTWGYGWTVVIAHGGSLTLYGHLNGDFVECGQVVAAGQNIAVSGNSGRSSGPHLHFEIRGSGGAPVNPWDYQSF